GRADSGGHGRRDRHGRRGRLDRPQRWRGGRRPRHPRRSRTERHPGEPGGGCGVRTAPKGLSSGRDAARARELADAPADAPGVCPVCGARSILPEGASSALLAVCEVLVVKALEVIGKRIVREERSRFKKFDGRPWHLAPTVWS